MTRTVTIDPVARIEGRARVTLHLDDAGRVADARVHVTELRGFETLCLGRLVGEMPALTARICGICPVAHQNASALAGDAVLDAPPPPAAVRLRELLQLAQVIQSHALSFFHLAAPDFVLGPGTPPERRSILGLAEAAPGLARDGVALRAYGQGVIETLSGQRIHGPFPVPGGVTHPLTPGARDAIRAGLADALTRAARTLAWWEEEEPRYADEAESCGNFPTPFLALVGPGGEPGFAGGRLRLLSAEGEILADGLDPSRYPELIAERVNEESYLLVPHWRALGFPQGAYRVGALARLNVVTSLGTPLADRALASFRALARGPVRSTFHAHRARLVEMVFALERTGALLDDPRLMGADVRSPPGRGGGEGVGACEAPRGTLFHRYRAGPDGRITWVDLLVASGQNAAAMDRAALQAARRWLDGATLTPELLDHVEIALRAFDPCLSCSTHAAGERMAVVQVVSPDGRVLDESR